MNLRRISPLFVATLRKGHADSRAASTFFCVAAAAASFSAAAGTPERDKSWDALIAEAKAHGGAETRLDQSASYIFQRPDGVYVSFTRLLKGEKRSVCLIGKDQNETICVDWDSGKTTWGSRADAATPWKLHEAASIEEIASKAPGPFDALSSAFQSMFGGKRQSRNSSPQGVYWRSQSGQGVWVNRN